MKEKRYCAHVCKNSRYSESSKKYCPNIWIEEDKVDAYVSPPDYKYCKECVKKGFKNNPEDMNAYRLVVLAEKYVYEKMQQGLELPEKDIKFIYNKFNELLSNYKKFGKRINTGVIFREALEIYGYYKEEQEAKQNIKNNSTSEDLTQS